MNALAPEPTKDAIPAKSPDEPEKGIDSRISEWGNPPAANSGYHLGGGNPVN